MNINEYQQMCDEEEDRDEFYEIARIGKNEHGIDGVVVWIGNGNTNKSYRLRIKICNIQDTFSPDNHFLIQMPGLDYDPNHVAKWITTKKLNDIFRWIKLNQKLLDDVESGSIDDSMEFLDKISSI